MDSIIRHILNGEPNLNHSVPHTLPALTIAIDEDNLKPVPSDNDFTGKGKFFTLTSFSWA